jgi:hypothetical protein
MTTQMFQVDGEALLFNKFITMDVIPEAFEVIVDFEDIMAGCGLLRAR